MLTAFCNNAEFRATLYATPPGFAFVFVGISRGSAPYGAPPPGYCMAPLRGSNLGSRLRCCAATPRQALALAKFPHHHPFKFRFIGLAECSEGDAQLLGQGDAGALRQDFAAVGAYGYGMLKVGGP